MEVRGSVHRLYRVRQMKGSAGRESNVKHSLENQLKVDPTVWTDVWNDWNSKSYWSLVSSLQSKAGVFCLSANDGTILEGQRFPANWQRVGARPKMIPRVEVTRPPLVFMLYFQDGGGNQCSSELCRLPWIQVNCELHFWNKLTFLLSDYMKLQNNVLSV